MAQLVEGKQSLNCSIQASWKFECLKEREEEAEKYSK
jgi:hypothetical protein